MPLRNHFSDRLQRNYRNDDWLSRAEAAKVLTENSDRDVSADYLKVLADRGVLHPQKVSERVWLYQYVELKEIVVKPTRGSAQFEHPTDNALRQRRWRERQSKKALLIIKPDREAVDTVVSLA